MQLKRSIIFSIFQEKVFPLYYMDKVYKVQVIHIEFSVVPVIVQLKIIFSIRSWFALLLSPNSQHQVA